MCLEEGGYLEAALPGRGQMIYFGEGRVCMEDRG